MELTTQLEKKRVSRDSFIGAAMICWTSFFFINPALWQLTGSNPWGLGSFGIFLGLVVVGPFLASLCLHPFRGLGVIPIAWLLVCVPVWVSVAMDTSELWAWYAVATGGGLIWAVTGNYRWTFLPYQLRSQFNPGPMTTTFDRVIILGILVCGLAGSYAHLSFHRTDPELAKVMRNRAAVVFTLFILVFAWVRLFRPFFELCVELVVRRNYRITSVGPGKDDAPVQGPLLVIANHACWWDPLFLAEGLPRPITPMMTSVFYDKWFLRPLMVYVFRAIRVADVRIRREAPEIQEAIRALDAGRCVVIFPEGFLRRKEEVPLRRFGRGVWEILKARPTTPVMACWIEGAWGSYASYFDGPPTKNKVARRHHPIAVGMSSPRPVPAELLDQHLRTRLYLMNEVSEARRHLSLPPLPTFTLSETVDEEATSPARPG